MYQASNEFKSAIQKTSRVFNARIKIKGTWYSQTLKAATATYGSNGNDDITIGSTVSSYVDVTMKPIGQLFGNTEVELQEGIRLPNGTYEYIRMGYFTAQRPTDDNGYIKFTAYDRMAKTEKLYSSSLSYPTTAIQVIDEICTQCGIDRATTGLETVYVNTKPEGYTCREVLGYMASLYGKFACIDRDGKLQIRWYEDSGYKIDISRIWSLNKNEANYTVGNLVCNIDKKKQITTGTGVVGITFDNPWMTQQQLENIYGKLNKFTYRPGTIKFLGDIRLDVWDIVSAYDLLGNEYKIPVMKIIQNYDGGSGTTIEAVGKTEEETNTDFKGPVVKGLERTYQELILANQIIAKKVDADWVRANTVTAQNMTAVNAEIQNIKNNYLLTNEADIKYANIETFNALSGKVETLEVNALTSNSAVIHDLTSDVSKINTLIYGNATGTAISTDFANALVAVLGVAQIKSAMIDSLDVDKINGKKISTSKFTVGSDSGNLEIADNTIQISDGTYIRVQIGKDGNDDYSINLWNASGQLIFSERGITENAIRDSIIRNEMVSASANIDASKLNIDSLFTEINGSTNTIKSTQIYVDDEGQTLSTIFSTIKNYNGGGVETWGSSIKATQDFIDQKLWYTSNVGDGTSMQTKYNDISSSLNQISAQIGKIVNENSGDVSAYTVLEVPTLNNYPAADWFEPVYPKDSEWTEGDYPGDWTWWYTEQTYKNHLGDMAYLYNTEKTYKFVILNNEDMSFGWKEQSSPEVGYILSQLTSIRADIKGVSAEVSSVKQTLYKDYSTTESTKALISASSTNILQSVSGTYVTKTSHNTDTKSLNASIELKLNKKDLVSELNASADVVRITANRFTLDSTYSKISPTGVVNFTAGTIGEWHIDIDEHNLNGSYLFGDNYERIVYMQIPRSDNDWVFSIQKALYAGPNCTQREGLWFVQATGDMITKDITVIGHVTENGRKLVNSNTGQRISLGWNGTNLFAYVDDTYVGNLTNN